MEAGVAAGVPVMVDFGYFDNKSYQEMISDKLRPGDIRNWLLSWIDPASMLFNRFEHDVGLTHSHTKI